MSEPKNDGPQWVPYQPPPPQGKERVWRSVRRLSFPLILLLFVGGLGALLYYSPGIEESGRTLRQFFGLENPSQPEPTTALPPRETLPMMRDSLAAAQETSSSEGLGNGFARLSVFSEPSDAAVLIDGDTVGTTPLNRYELRSGVYIISVQREGFFAADTVAILRDNETPTYSVALSARASQAGQQPPVLADQGSPVNAPSESDAGQETTSSANPTSDGTSTSQQPPLVPESDVAPPSTTQESADQAVTTGTLRFTSTPAGALVQLDGEVVGTTPLTLNAVEAGSHEVMITQSGYDTSRTQLTLTPQTEREVQVTLNRQMGRLRVLVRPWGSIYINGQLRERNVDVWFEVPLPPGEHEIAAVHPALGRQTRTVTLNPGERYSLTIDLRNPPPNEEDGVSARDTTSGSSNNRP